MTTFVKQNVEDRDHIFKYALQHHYAWYYSTCCYPSLRGSDTDVRECALSAYDLGCSREVSKEWNENPIFKTEKKPCEYCDLYRTGYVITWDGYMRFCLFLNKPEIDALGESFEENWKALQEYSESIRWPEKCYTCEIKDKCRKCIATLACNNGGIGRVKDVYCKKIFQLLK